LELFAGTGRTLDIRAGDSQALEEVYRKAGFLIVSVRAVPIKRRFLAADAIKL
jgi:hypothetical protein